jgi:hypothetical protein
MPPLPPVPNVFLIQFKHTYSNDTDVACRVHCAFTGGSPSGTDLATYAQHIMSQASATWASSMSTAVTLTLVTVIDLSSPTGAVGTSSTSVPGTRAGGELPASTCVLWNQKVARRYRGGKPRVYLPWGVATDLLDAQHWSAAAITNFQSGLGNVIAALQGVVVGPATTGTLRNVSYYQGSTATLTGTGTAYERGHTRSTPRATPLVDALTANTINPRPASQRRRLQFSN